MTLTQVIFAVLCALPRHTTDADEAVEDRRARLALTAQAISDATARATCSGAWKTADCKPVWKGSRRELAAAIVVLGKYESHYARYVAEHRCKDGPPRSRCDEGRSRGLWQAQERACPDLWTVDAGSPASIAAGAWCAGRLLAVGYRRCKWWIGAYGFYAGRGCYWSGGEDREATLRGVLKRFNQVESAARSPTAATADQRDNELAVLQVRAAQAALRFVNGDAFAVVLGYAEHDAAR